MSSPIIQGDPEFPRHFFDIFKMTNGTFDIFFIFFLTIFVFLEVFFCN
jgi:hypothetical protein